MVRRFLVALQFLTKIPVNIHLTEEDLSPSNMANTLILFPLVGLMLGLFLVGFDYLIRGLQFNPLLQNSLLFSFYILLTGGLHLDGYMDTVDGLLPAVSPIERQKIMKDSHIGAFAALLLVLLLLVKVGLFMELTGTIRYPALFLLPIFSRWSLVLAATFFKNPKQEGLGHLFSQGMDKKKLFQSTLLLLPLWVILSPQVFLLLPLLLLSTQILGWWITSRIQGLTGDCYGFIHELNEILILLFLILRGGYSYS